MIEQDGVTYPDLDDAMEVIGAMRDAGHTVGPVADIGLLDSALARPRTSAYGTDAYPTVPLKAAALLSSLVRNHALVDGNKRTAWIITRTFIEINGWMLDVNMTTDACEAIVLDVATGRVTTVEDIADRLTVID